MRSILLTVLAGVIVVVSGLALAEQYSLEWLRVGSVVVAVMGAAIATMVIKRRRAARSRSSAPDSIEAVQDAQTRAAAFVDAIILTAVALMVAVLMPAWPAWVICFTLLASLAIAYWVRRLVVARDAD